MSELKAGSNAVNIYKPNLMASTPKVKSKGPIKPAHPQQQNLFPQGASSPTKV